MIFPGQLPPGTPNGIGIGTETVQTQLPKWVHRHIANLATRRARASQHHRPHISQR